MEPAAAVAEDCVQAEVTILDRFARPGTVAGIVTLRSWVTLGKVIFGVVWDFLDINGVSFSNPAFYLWIILDEGNDLVCDLLGEE